MLQYTVFITGANKGLGLEFVRQYAAANWRVLASCRSLVHAKDLQSLSKHFNNISLLQLDVTNHIQITQLAHQYKDTPIDLLINNAGIYIEDELGAISVDTMKHAFMVNSIAPLKIAETFCSNIAASHLKTIISLSTKTSEDPNRGLPYNYRASKSALNVIMKNLALDLKDKNIKVFSINPGSVKTDIGGSHAILSTEESVTNIRSLLSRLTLRDSGRFIDLHGNVATN